MGMLGRLFGVGLTRPAAGVAGPPSEADAGNVYQRWKGAVEPLFAGGSGNEYQRWKGAVEPGA